MVNRSLAAEFCFLRSDGDAIGGRPAIAAPLADGLVDERPHGRVGVQAALAPSAFLGGAGLIVDKDRHSFNVAKVALKRVQIIAMVEGNIGGEMGADGVFPGFVGDHGDPLYTFGAHLLADNGHIKRPVHGLAACHGDGVVVENFIGNVDLGGDGGADCQDS